MQPQYSSSINIIVAVSSAAHQVLQDLHPSLYLIIRKDLSATGFGWNCIIRRSAPQRKRRKKKETKRISEYTRIVIFIHSL